MSKLSSRRLKEKERKNKQDYMRLRHNEYERRNSNRKQNNLLKWLKQWKLSKSFVNITR